MNPRLNALQLTPIDTRDFSHTTLCGTISVDDLPTHDFLVSVPYEIKNQDINYPSDYCTSYAASECAEDEDQVIFCPEWTFAQAKGMVAQREGPEAFNRFGLNLRDICMAAVKKGFIPRHVDPYKCDTMDRPNRIFLVNPANWPPLEQRAAQYRKGSFLSVDGPHDLFDNFRAAMWQNLAERRSIITGAMWKEEWTDAIDGVIPKTYNPGGSGHSFKVCGQKTINNEIHLIVQGSDGQDTGDQGFFYFPREVVNKEFIPFGGFVFTHLPPDSVRWHVTNGVTIYDSLPLKILKYLRIISKYIKI